MALPKDKPKPRVYRKKKGFKTVDGKRVPIYGKPELVFPTKQPGFPHQDPRREGGIEGQERHYRVLPLTTWNPGRRRLEVPEPEARQIVEDAQWKMHPRNKRQSRRSGGKPIPRNEPMNPFLSGKGERALRKLYPEGKLRGKGGNIWFSDEPLRRGPRGTKPGTRMAKEAWERKRKQWQMDMEDEERRQELMNQPRNPRKPGVGLG